MSATPQLDGRAEFPAAQRPSQYLAVPLGSLAPAHRTEQVLSRWWRRRSSVVLMAAGLAAAAAAAAISASPEPGLAFVDGAGVHIGGVTLSRAAWSPVPGYALYTGAAAVLVERGPRITRTTGVATIDGSTATGVCEVAPTSTTELLGDCAFTLGGRRLTSRDQFDPRAGIWRRVYSDGVSVSFSVPAGSVPVPVPLALGR